MININGTKYQHIFTLDKYTQGGMINQQFLSDVVSNYDPANNHQACFWVGHYDIEKQSLGKDEPKALAWVASLLLMGNKLYCSFNSISSEMIELIEKEAFKYVSCEFVMYKVDGKDLPYLYAVALTNRPASKGMEPLNITFTDQQIHKFNPNFSAKKVFSQKINYFSNQNNNAMNQYLISAATKLGLDFSKFTDESALSEAVVKVYTDLNAKVTGLETKVTELSKKSGTPDESKKYADELAILKKGRIDDLLDNAVNTGKVTADKKESFRKFAESDFEACKSMFAGMQADPLFKSKQVGEIQPPSKVNLTDAKFKKADGTLYTFDEVMKDPSLVAKFTDDELLALEATAAGIELAK